MARLRRLSAPGYVHQLIQRGNNGQPIFVDAQDYETFLNVLRQAALSTRVAIHAYSLTPGQFHLLATPADAQGLSRMMQDLGRCYVAAFNRRHRRTGGLWEGRFRATVIEAQSYLWPCIGFVELAPVREGLVCQPQDYRWSSVNHHLGLISDSLVSDHPMYWALLGNTPFEREAAHRALLERALTDDEVMKISAALKGWALGSEQFIAAVEAQTQRRARPGRRGRPSKATTVA